MTEAKKSAAGGGVFVVGAAMLWGTTGTAQSFAPPGFDPLIVGTCRLTIGGIVLMLLALKSGEIKDLFHWPWFKVLLAAVFMAAYQLSFFAAVVRTGVAVGTIVGIGSSPIAAGILAYLFRKEQPARIWYVATLVAISGCMLLGLTKGTGNVRIEPLGLFLAITAGAVYAASTLAVKDVLEKHSPTSVMAVVVCAGALFLIPLFFFRPIGWLAQPAGIAVVLHLGFFSMALSYWLFARGLQRVPVATAVTLSLAEPMTAGLLGVIIVGERLPFSAWCGLGLILCGLLVLALPHRRYQI